MAGKRPSLAGRAAESRRWCSVRYWPATFILRQRRQHRPAAVRTAAAWPSEAMSAAQRSRPALRPTPIACRRQSERPDRGDNTSAGWRSAGALDGLVVATDMEDTKMFGARFLSSTRRLIVRAL